MNDDPNQREGLILGIILTIIVIVVATGIGLAIVQVMP